MKQSAFALLAVLFFLPASHAGSQRHLKRAVVHDPIVASPPIAGDRVTTRSAMMPAGPLVVAPPPGTLGETYFRVSHPIPDDEHPRSAMLAVRDKNAVKYLRVQRMGGFRMKNGIWLFEASRPLFPGQDHVVRVEARKDTADIEPYKVKFVRLIPGRIVYLDF